VKEYAVKGYEFIRVQWDADARVEWKRPNEAAQSTVIPGAVLRAICRVEGREMFEQGLDRLLAALGEEKPS
jgi:hypothetical protein